MAGLARTLSVELEKEGESGGRRTSTLPSQSRGSGFSPAETHLLDSDSDDVPDGGAEMYRSNMGENSSGGKSEHRMWPAESLLRLLFVRKQTQNIGSHARDHLANERTFLAWVRTAMGSVGLGVAIAKLDLVGSDTTSKLAALVFVAIGTVFLLYCSLHYFRVLQLLNKGLFEANKWGVLFVVASCTVAVVICSILLVLG